MAKRLTATLAASGAVPLLTGLAVQALTTYLFLVIAGRELGAVGFAALSGLYLLLTSTATGLMAPLEQEVTRRRAHQRAAGTWDDTLFRRAVVHGLLAAALASVCLLAAWPATLRILGDERTLLVSLLVALPGYACWFATRGELAGTRRLGRYGVQLAVDGLLRLAVALVLVSVSSESTAAYGAAFALSPWLTLALTWTPHHTPPGAVVQRGTQLGSRFALLVLSALAAQLLINAGPLVVNLLAEPDERAAAGLYLAALVVIRVPVFLFTAVQPSFLRALAEHVGRGERSDFSRLLRRILTALVSVTAVAAIGAALLAPATISWLFDFDEQLGRVTCLLLTVAIGLFLVATVLAQGVLALGHHHLVTAGWLLGLVGLAAGTVWPGSAVDRATNGLLVGALVATVSLAVLLRREVSRWPDTLDGDLPGLAEPAPTWTT